MTQFVVASLSRLEVPTRTMGMLHTTVPISLFDTRVLPTLSPVILLPGREGPKGK